MKTAIINQRALYMSDANKEKIKKDNKDKRSGTDRRKFQYTACIPERRTGEDRRRQLVRERGFER